MSDDDDSLAPSHYYAATDWCEDCGIHLDRHGDECGIEIVRGWSG